jgi:isoquinoline 1-oxidoreductase beta subunit
MADRPFSGKRRAFLIGAAMTSAGALFTIAGCQRAAQAPGSGVEGAAAAGRELNAWITILPSNRVVFKIPQAEIGQGGLTSISQLLAEELDVDWDSITPQFYDPSVNVARSNVYVYAVTLSSSSIAMLMEPTRIAAAQIRAMLVQAAANRWGQPAAALTTGAGQVRHAASGRVASYAELAPEAVRLPLPDPRQLLLKAPGQWRYIGKSMARVDIPSKVDGSAVYGIDLHLPGMKYAAIRQSPVFGGRLKAFDRDGAKKLPGVVDVVKVRAGPSGRNEPTAGWGIDYGMDDAVAVIADDWWTAKSVLDQLHIEWEEGGHAQASSAAIAADFHAALDQPGPDMKVVRQQGDIQAAFAGAARVFEARYSVPFTEHAPMEPINCTAVVRDDGVEVWAASQFPDEALRLAAQTAKVPLERARFHLMLGGGGFGRRINSDYVAQAVQIAQAFKGTPVKLLWTREESIRRSYYPPYTLSAFRAGMDRHGRLVAWESRSVGGRAPDQSYGTSRLVQMIPNMRISYEQRNTPPPFGWKRGVGFAQHTWMNQCFLNEIARASGQDPLAFQLALLRPDELPAAMEKRELEYERVAQQRKVLLALGRAVEWPRPRLAGKGSGIAVHDMSYWPEYTAAAAAAMVTVSIGKQGVRVERVVVVLDAGQIVNPDNVVAQVQGGVAFALTDTLYSAITLEAGRVAQSNFHDYPILRMSGMPQVEVHLLPSSGPPHGVGELPVPLVIAALVNAIADAGGPQIRHLPALSQGLAVA